MHPAARALFTALLLGSLASCTVPLSDLTAIRSPEISILTSQDDISRICEEKTVRRRGVAGFEAVPDAREAFVLRLAAIEAARKSLDLQYYIWRDDVSGNIIAARLLAAADRGVRVRLLLDMTHGAQNEVRSSALAAHPNIEIGFYNPMEDLQGLFVGNPIPVVGEIDRMQRRMHNKMLIADGSLLIAGGRNLGDEYFAISKKRNMRDLDFAGAGPVVQAAKRSFDHYWTCSLTRHANLSKISLREKKDLQKLRNDVLHKTARLAAHHKCPYPMMLSRAEALRQIQAVVGRMIWAEYEFIADPPERTLRTGRLPSPVAMTLERTVRAAQREVIMHSAYLIPQEGTLAIFREVTARGVKLELLTNSMASIDAVAAICGIAGRRDDILAAGASLHELDVHAASRKGYLHTRKPTPLGMHTKGMVVDGRVSFIGSYNMDPRSKFINTETGVLIKSPAFAARLAAYLREDFKPENSWQLSMREDGGFLWSRHIPGKKPETHKHDPHAPMTRRVFTWIFQHVISEDVL